MFENARNETLKERREVVKTITREYGEEEPIYTAYPNSRSALATVETDERRMLLLGVLGTGVRLPEASSSANGSVVPVKKSNWDRFDCGVLSVSEGVRFSVLGPAFGSNERISSMARPSAGDRNGFSVTVEGDELVDEVVVSVLVEFMLVTDVRWLPVLPDSELLTESR
jgi:hypothetical protein